jgi:plastocyanin
MRAKPKAIANALPLAGGARWLAVVPGLLLSVIVSAANHTVTASGMSFSPKNLAINAGDTVTFRNDGGLHNAASDPGSVTMFRCANGCAGAGGNGNPSSALWSATVSFPTAGTVGYYCEIHGAPGGGGMSGTITIAAVAVVPHRCDFNGDGRSDILWRNSSSGANVIWRSASSTAPQAVAAVPVAWRAVGLGDYNGDGRSDILWRNSSTGANVIWRSGNSATPQAVTGVTSLAWTVVGSGDYNGDGKADILWRNTQTGANVIWRSASPAITQAMPALGLSWKAVGSGDYNGDGRADVLWRNTGTGANMIWLAANPATRQAVTGVSSQAWAVVGFTE